MQKQKRVPQYAVGDTVMLREEGDSLSFFAEVVEDCGGETVRLKTDGSNMALRLKSDIYCVLSLPEGLQRRRECLPYGEWTCEDGREVLFNRDYTPIHQRTADGTVTVPDSKEWVRFSTEEWFYRPERCVPWSNRALSKALVKRLTDWGIAAPLLEG